jgi:hypothetical protein
MTDPLLRATTYAGMPPIQEGDIFSLPIFRRDFVSESFPLMNGEVVLRFPVVSDEIDVERRMVQSGGSYLTRGLAMLAVCIEKAPASWYRPSAQPSPDPKAPATPSISLGHLPDTIALMQLAKEFLAWRDDFRSPGGTAAP